MTLISAREFAIKAHGNQRYGDLPYPVHLQSVVDILADFNYHDHYSDAGWLHDVVEEPGVPEEEIERLFGPWVRKVVHSCYAVASSRAMRNAIIYHRMLEFSEAAPVKIADRIAHVEFCEPGSKHAKMYLKERLEFQFHIAHRFPVMNARLNQAYQRLKIKDAL